MRMFYKVSDNELLEIRDKIFRENGISSLINNGFEKSPFSTAWYGKNNLNDYTYELCRLSSKTHLEVITTHISKGDRWIKITLNIFKLEPKVELLDQLKGVDGLLYSLPPNSLTKMRLRVDDIQGMPLFNFTEHKIKSYYSEAGLNKRVNELGQLIYRDMENIDSFIQRWHEMHQPNVVDWEGREL